MVPPRAHFSFLYSYFLEQMITSSDLLFAFSCIHTNAQVNRFCVQKSTVYNTKMHYHFSISTLVCGVHGSDQSINGSCTVRGAETADVFLW